MVSIILKGPKDFHWILSSLNFEICYKFSQLVHFLQGQKTSTVHIKALSFSDEASKSDEEREAERKEKAKQRRSRTNFSLEQVLDFESKLWIYDVLDIGSILCLGLNLDHVNAYL